MIRVQSEQLPKSAPDYTALGPTIKELLPQSLKPSDNWLTEQLYFMTVAKLNPSLSTYSPKKQIEEGAKIFTDFFIKTMNLSSDEIRFFQGGSGLGRHSLLTVKALNKALLWNEKQPTALLFKNSLAIPKEAGTLKQRLIDVKGYFKTGQMDRAVALTGYVTASNGEERVASIIVNGSNASMADLRAFVDQCMNCFTEESISEKD